MVDVQEIEAAIGAHGMWKNKLKSVIATRQTDIPVTTIATDNSCKFGKWLYSLSVAEKSTPQFQNIKDLHAQFHRVAGKVAKLGVEGHNIQAEALISGEFNEISSKLTQSMMAWKKG